MRFRINITIDCAEKVMQKWQGELPVANCSCKLPVARCKLVIYLVLQATVKKKEKINTLPNLCKTGPGAKTNKLSRSQRRQQPKTNVGRSRNSTWKTQDEHRMQLVMVQFPFFFLSLFEYLWNATRVASCTLQLAVGRLQTFWIPLWVIKCVAGATLWAPRATTVQQADALNVLPLLAGIQHHQQDNL